jgi:signal transduction histidine kinase
VEALSEPTSLKPLFIYDSASAPFGNPGNNPVTVPMKGIEARVVRVRCLEYPDRHEIFGLSEIEVYSDGTNIAIGKDVALSGNRRDRPRSMLVDGYTSFGKILTLPQWIAKWNERIDLEKQISVTGTLLAKKSEQRNTLHGTVLIGSIVVTGLGFCSWQWYSHRRLKQRQNAFRTQMTHYFHDEIGSSLAGIARLCEVAVTEPDRAQVDHDLESIRRMASETNRSMHETLWLVDTSIRSGMGVMASVREFAERALAGIELHWFDWSEVLPKSMTLAHQKHLFLLCKELITNIAKHAAADRVYFSVKREGDTCRIQIQDFGKGFVVESASQGIGLESVRTRAKQIGAKLLIDSRANTGTTVSIELKLK